MSAGEKECKKITQETHRRSVNLCVPFQGREKRKGDDAPHSSDRMPTTCRDSRCRFAGRPMSGESSVFTITGSSEEVVRDIKGDDGSLFA